MADRLAVSRAGSGWQDCHIDTSGSGMAEFRWLAVSGQQFLAGWQFRWPPPAAVAGIAQSARDNSLHQVPPLPGPGIGIAVTQELGALCEISKLCTMCKISKSAHLRIFSKYLEE